MNHIGTDIRSAARLWAPLRPFIAAEARLGARASQNRVTAAVYEFLRFGVKQAWACLFGGIMVALLIGTALWYPPGAALHRYDALFAAALAVQAGLLIFRLETLEEAKVICLFHIVGTAMEIFKTGIGSWIYPEASVMHIAGVPLFTGFMYASIGSYIARVWRLFDFRFRRHPPMATLVVLSAAIYVNFFAHHFIPDLRIGLFAAAAILFGRTVIVYTVWRDDRSMPLLIACGLVSLFIWLAENIGTLTRTWLYPNQLHGWTPVTLGKLSSWYLLLIISYTLVALVHRPRNVGARSGRAAARGDPLTAPGMPTPGP